MKQSKWFVSHTQPENGLHWKNHQQFGIAIKYFATSELYNKGFIFAEDNLLTFVLIRAKEN